MVHCVYRKPTHTDQYLTFNSLRYSHHPIEHKLSVVRTLFDRSQSLISDSTDRHAENLHIEKALRDCGHPDWTFQKVKKQIKMKPLKRKQQQGQHPLFASAIKTKSQPAQSSALLGLWLRPVRLGWYYVYCRAYPGTHRVPGVINYPGNYCTMQLC